MLKAPKRYIYKTQQLCLFKESMTYLTNLFFLYHIAESSKHVIMNKRLANIAQQQRMPFIYLFIYLSIYLCVDSCFLWCIDTVWFTSISLISLYYIEDKHLYSRYFEV